MPCGFCGVTGHNIRTCERFGVLSTAEEHTNIEPNVIRPDPRFIRSRRTITTVRHDLVTFMDDIGLHDQADFITPNHSTSTSPLTPLTLQPILPDPIITNHFSNFGLIRIPSFDNIANIFNDDDDTLFDDLPDLIPIEPTDPTEPIEPTEPTEPIKLVTCVEHPCSTDSCAICMDNLSSVDLLVTRCGHQFHATCMIQHIKKKDDCPLCRGILYV